MFRVCPADPITNHQHSLLIAFRNDHYTDSDDSSNEQKLNDYEHPVICYVKADTTEEIRCWQNVLQVFARNTIHATPNRSRDSPEPAIEHVETSQVSSFKFDWETFGIHSSVSLPSSNRLTIYLAFDAHLNLTSIFGHI